MAELYGKNGKFFSGEEASESQLYRLDRDGSFTGGSIVAFATHGLVSGDFDELVEPALALSQETGDASEEVGGARRTADGFLLAGEVTSLQLKDNLILLSACNTISDNASGEGLGGLASAFLYAGADSVLATHWEVFDDLAPQITTRFLEAASAGSNIDRSYALRNAIARFVAENPDFSHPVFWSAFVLLGT